ncbi:MAG: UDP-N-acetylmuramate--L-alanine ligase [Deltaproteobacteria bacterium]|nr:UDP-N-acetylmuramate--L-alanine ligase [Deltaproteobacteria bacterium]
MIDVIQRLEDLTLEKPIHMSGIGGSAMNGLAILLTQKGFQIRGTDPAIDPITRQRLEQQGIKVFLQQDGSAIADDTQLLITTAALKPSHPELQIASEMAIPILKYAAMLGVVMNSSRGVAIAGTHGKTTTTALVVSALRGAELNPGFVIGGYVDQFGAGAFGGKDCFVAEACEYDRSFLNLHPQIALITNIEADHLDIYSGIDDIIDSFHQFTQNLPPNGTLVYCSESSAATALARRFHGNAVSYGFDTAQFTATDISSANGLLSFNVRRFGAVITRVTLKLPGRHNVLNALGAFCVGLQLGCAPIDLANGLSKFEGVRRRFEVIGIRDDVCIVDDYAHHPTEIRALLQGTKERFPKGRIVVAFQPHQISRTRFFFNDFANAFNGADKVFLPDIYVARDIEAPPEITSENLALQICKNGIDAEYTRNFDITAQRAVDYLRPGDVFLTVGAGNVYEVAHKVFLSLG